MAFVIAVSSAFFIVDPVLSPIEEVEACTRGQYYDGSKCTDYGGGINGKKMEDDLQSNVMRILNSTVAILLAFSIINIIYSALQLTMKGVNPQIAEEAKRRLLLTFFAVVMLVSLLSIFRLVQSIVV